MISVIIILFLTNVINSIGYEFPEINTVHYRILTVNLRNVNNFIVFDKDDNADDMLINSIMTTIFTDNTVILIKGESDINSTFPNIKKAVITNDPIIFILIKTLDVQYLENEIYRDLFNSSWSMVHIVITIAEQNVSEGCISDEMFLQIKEYANVLWHTFITTRILVSLPYICPDYYIIFDGKEWTGEELYNRSIKVIKTTNIEEIRMAVGRSGDPRFLTKGYPLKANMFFRFPTSIKNCRVFRQYTNMKPMSNNSLCGLDGMVMNDYVTHYNFNLIIPQDESCNSFGYYEDTINVTSGSLGCLVRKVIDISFNSRFLVLYTKHKLYYLHYVTRDSLCIVLKTPDQIPLWLYAVNTFPLSICGVFLSLFIILGILTWLNARLLLGNRTLTLQKYVSNAIVSSTFGFSLHKEHRNLIIKSISFICSIIIVAEYQGYVNYQFTTITYYKECKTLEDFYYTKNHLYMSPSIAKVLASSKTLTYIRKTDKGHRIHVRKNASAELVLSQKDTATVRRKQDVMLEWLAVHGDKKGMPLIYILDECLRTYLLSYVARPGFLFVEESIKFMMRLLEAGLPSKYYTWTKRTFTLSNIFEKSTSRPRPFKKIHIEDLRISFIILTMGYMVTILIFILERRRGKDRLKKSEAEPKYLTENTESHMTYID